jgi:lipopolysaccharide export system permease protein
MAAGISRIRTARPIIAAAVVIVFLSIVMREAVLPAFREKLVGEARDMLGNEVQQMRAQIDHETQIFMRGDFLKITENRIHRPNFILPRGLDAAGINLAAVDAVYEPPTAGRPSGYRFKGVTTPTALLQLPSVTRGDKIAIYTPADHPDFLAPDEVFLVSNVKVEQLREGATHRQFQSTAELIRGLRNPSLDYGADVRVAIHSRITQPLADMTLLFLGLPLVLRRETKNIYAAVFMCLVLTMLFFLINITCQYLGGVLLIRPSLAAWLPLMIFIPVAVGFCSRIDR